MLAGVLLCFIPIVGEFVIPDLLGGSQSPMIGQTIWMEFFGNRDWPVASAVAVVLVCLLVTPIVIYQHQAMRGRGAGLIMRKVSAFNFAAIFVGIAFLYLPIVVLVIYSFNASRLVAVWGGWSTRWYAELLNDRPLLDAASISIRLALPRRRAATMLGTLAALALVRFGRFRGRLPFAAMVYAPLVMPEVITGLSLAAAVRRRRRRSRLLDGGDRAHHDGDVLRHRDRAVAPGRFRHEPRRGGDGSRRPPLRTFFVGDVAADLAGDCGGVDARFRAVARRSGDRELHHRARRDHAADPHLFRGASRREAGDECGMQRSWSRWSVSPSIIASLLAKITGARGTPARV